MLALCVVVAAGPAAAQAAFDGTWVANVIRPVSGNQNLTIELKTSEGKERWSPSFRQLSGQIKVKSGFIDQAASGCDEVGQSPGLGAAPTLYASSGVRSPSDECGRRLL